MAWATYNVHKERHLEVPEYVYEVKLLIGDPDIVYVDDNSGCVHLYRLGLGRGKYAKAYLWAGIYYRPNTGGRLASYHFTSRCRNGLRLEEYRFLTSLDSGRRIGVGTGDLE